jgi:hypothetical protein
LLARTSWRKVEAMRGSDSGAGPRAGRRANARVAWLIYVGLWWTILNTLTLPEYARLWTIGGSGFRSYRLGVVASALLPFCSPVVADSSVFFALAYGWPVLTMLCWKWINRDWTLASGWIGMAWGLGLSGTSLALVSLAAEVAVTRTETASGVAITVLSWGVRELLFIGCLNYATAFLSRRIRPGRLG